MARVEHVLVASWRVASEQFRDAASAASDLDMRRRLAKRAFDLAQRAECVERLALEDVTRQG